MAGGAGLGGTTNGAVAVDVDFGTGRMEAPGIGGVSFGNDARGTDGTTDGRPPITNAVAGVGLGAPGGIAGRADGGGTTGRAGSAGGE